MPDAEWGNHSHFADGDRGVSEWTFSGTAADGSRIGRIDDIRNNTVGVIYNGRYIRIPVETLSDTDRGVTTSLTRKEAGKL